MIERRVMKHVYEVNTESIAGRGEKIEDFLTRAGMSSEKDNLVKLVVSFLVYCCILKVYYEKTERI